ncbi:MAG: hypothetical protein JWP16_1738, partial [Alphaproteobacteria bacterium]|nr:hypothetical protein [Alphaproteobacteria bacterium]
ASADPYIRIQSETWTAADERGYGEFIAGIGAGGCRTVDGCLRDPANPFRAGDPPDFTFRSDCADLPYFLRFYYAWKRGLPFSYVSDVSPRGRARDIRYSARGNQVEERRDVRTGDNALAVLEQLRDQISSATYRIHPLLEGDDLYSPAITPRSIRPGTVIYDPNGHLAVVWKIEGDGRIRYIDAHPDNSLTRGYYDLRFVRASPGMGAGFKNWRPVRLVGATRARDGSLVGGRILLAPIAEIGDFALTQFFGTGARPGDDSDWRRGTFVLNGQRLDWYDYVRASLGGGGLHFDPLREIADMVASNCADLGYRADAVTLALAAGIQNQPQPDRLPPNIYGTQGDWETWSTPSRDARLKTAFKEVRDNAQRFVTLWRAGDPQLNYRGGDLPGDMLAVHDRAAAGCTLSYARSDGSRMLLNYEEARRRLFRLSFDPHHCVELRWGAVAGELATCRDGALKRRWYDAEQRLRNQLDRTYEARMDFTLGELEAGLPGTGPLAAPDTDAHGYLLGEQQTRPQAAKR